MGRRVKIVKKNDEYSPEYMVGDILEVDSTWYGGVTVKGRTGVPVSLDREEYEELEAREPEAEKSNKKEEQKAAAVDLQEIDGKGTSAENLNKAEAGKMETEISGNQEGKGIATELRADLQEIERQVRDIVGELLAVSNLEEGDVVVIGCSSSEVADKKIGSYSSSEIGRCIAKTAMDVLNEKNIFLAAQCCEHLNRALIVEKKYAKENRLPIVNVVPQLKAGGSFATSAYKLMEEPVAIENISAQAGIDIGDTLIGMHLAPVAVPVRPTQKTVGAAHVVMARTRAKYIGGERAAYLK
jgi:uncharacterized protein (TIGR01440 family)